VEVEELVEVMDPAVVLIVDKQQPVMELEVVEVRRMMMV
jgi:hypothetical protein